MMKLRFNLNRLSSEKTEGQKVALPAEKELNERELATVTGGWCGHGWDDECGGCWWGHHHHHWHHRHYW